MIMKQILIIDDEPDILRLIRKILENQGGYSVTTVEKGKKAEEMIETTKFDLVITDIIMPEIEGMEIIFFLKKHSPATKILAISGGGKLSPDGYLTIASTAGAHSVLQKPFETQELLREVEQLLYH